MKKIKNPVSLGSFGEKDANHIAGTLALHMDIRANVTNVVVDSGPTCWFVVEVALKDVKPAKAYIKGWRVGRIFQTMEDNPASAVLWPEYAAFFPTP